MSRPFKLTLLTSARRWIYGISGLAIILLSGCQQAPKLAGGQAKPASPVKFADVTEAAGLNFKQLDGGCGLAYFLEPLAAGASFLDANGDGALDIYFSQPQPVGDCKSKPEFAAPLHQRLYLNDGKGHFRLAPNAFGGVETDYGLASAVGDYDNDGRPDLYVCCYGKSRLFHNRGDGTFQDVTAKASVGVQGLSCGAVFFDYDGDGFQDLYVTRYCDWNVATDVACWTEGTNGHREREPCTASTYLPSYSVLFHNNGDSTFTDVTKRALPGQQRGRSLNAAAADFNSDGRLDLFVSNDLGPNFLYINQGNGTFKDEGMIQNVAFGLTGRSQSNMGLAIGDYDEDGKLDVLVTTFSTEPYTLYHNEGDFFTDLSAASGIARATMPYLGFGTGFFDATNNGHLDLFLANGHIFPHITLKNPSLTYKQRNQFLLNDGHGKFIETPETLPADDIRVHRGACFGDIDNDGKIDILVTAENDQPTLLKNESTTGNYLLLQLTNKYGCATPVGTRCVATINGQQRVRVLLGGGSYAGESDARVHFGLGPATQVDKLEIHWLSGKTQTLEHIKANQILKVREPT